MNAKPTAKPTVKPPGTVRITGGRAKGLRLDVPPGQGVRPTADRARETLFNILINRFRKPGGASLLQGARVLDAFAGTGALGLEAWSRGAAFVAFAELSREHRRVLTQNVTKAKLPAADFLIEPEAVPAAVPFDLILADPPYAQGDALLARLLAKDGLWSPDTLVVWERDSGTAQPAPVPAGWHLVHEKTVGRTVFSFLASDLAAEPGAG